MIEHLALKYSTPSLLCFSMFKVSNRLIILICYLGVEKGSKDPKAEMVGKVTIDQLRTIAAEKLPDLNCSSIESAMRIIAGTAANIGIVVDPPVLDPNRRNLCREISVWPSVKSRRTYLLTCFVF